MQDVLIDTLVDAAKLLPFLFVAFLLIEYLEHKISKKNQTAIARAGKYGPVIGALLGILPQCGFSAMATNLYATRIVSLGTLIAVYLSTSDEMLPIMLSEQAPAGTIIGILALKFGLGMLFGLIIDAIWHHVPNKDTKVSHELCEHAHCDCEHHSVFTAALKHTLSTTCYILIITFVINWLFFLIGQDRVAGLFLRNSIFGPFVAALVGLIPNCAASITITELYLTGVISFGSVIAGLLSSAGVGLLVLFRLNRHPRENIRIIGLLYAISVLCGMMIEIINLF